MTGASSSALRNYTRDYARHLSTEATTTPRRFTEDDIRLIAYVIDCTKNRGLKHEEVAESLLAGAMDDFEWEPPTMPHADVTAQDDNSGHLVPVERLQAAQHAAQVILDDTKRRESEATEELKTAQERIAELERELGKAEGKLEGVEASRYHAPAWWKALFGGSWIGNP